MKSCNAKSVETHLIKFAHYEDLIMTGTQCAVCHQAFIDRKEAKAYYGQSLGEIYQNCKVVSPTPSMSLNINPICLHLPSSMPHAEK
jgi:hypothetical protein